MTAEQWSYAVASLASCGAVVALWRTQGLVGRRARLAMVMQAIGAAWLALYGQGDSALAVRTALLLPLVEVLRGASLIWLMHAMIFEDTARAPRRLSSLLLLGSLAFATIGPFWLGTARTLSLGGVFLAFNGLFCAEQLLRSRPSSLLAVRLCVVGIGGLFAYDLFLYSQGELLGGLHRDTWAMRGVAMTLLTPVAVVGLRRFADEAVGLFVSRQVVFYTTALFSVGLYVLAMALGGYYVRAYGGTWGESLRVVFFIGAGAVLALLMLSPNLWRRVRVFLAKHFYRNKYDYRVEWLRFIDTLSGDDAEDARLVSIRAIAQIFESPGGVLFQRSESSDSFEPFATWSAPGRSPPPLAAISAEQDLPRFLAERQWVIDLSEYRQSPDLYRNIRLPGELLAKDARWRLIAPLLQRENLLGFLVLEAPPAPFQMTFEDRDLLKTVGRHVATLLAQQAAERRLAEGRQFDAFNRFAAFVMHDLKNSVAQLQLLVDNSARHKGNPRFMDDAIETVGNTTARMTHLIEQLGSKNAASAARRISIRTLIEAAARRSELRQPTVLWQPTPEAQDELGAEIQADPERLVTMLEHVIRNAQDAAGLAGQVTAAVTVAEGKVLIGISDNGPGMNAEFVRDRLFRPFDSTKGSKGMGIGAYQVREYVHQMGGTVEVQSTPGRGTRFSITLPLCQIPSRAS